MPFDITQPSYVDLREGWKTRTRSIVVWVGAGLSKPAGIPLWGELAKHLIDEGKELLKSTPDDKAGKRRRGLLQVAESQDNYWRTFGFLEEALGPTSYDAAIRRALSPKRSMGVPQNYQRLWELRPAGIVDLNLDGLSAQAHASVSRGEERLIQFEGGQIASRIHILQTTDPWVARLHGSIDARDTWTFTERELEKLFENPGYSEFITALFTTRCNVFLGMSVDDVSTGGHLERLKKRGLHTGDHFWITHRTDTATRDWAEYAGLRIVTYEGRNNDHSQLAELLEDLLAYLPHDPAPPLVHPEKSLVSTPASRSQLPSPSDVQGREPEEIRGFLNSQAIAILNHGSTRDAIISKYNELLKQYNRAVALAWNVETFPPDNILFGHEILEQIGEGAFGRVFRANHRDGAGSVAIKLLHDRVRRDPLMLTAFRRGVASMRILAQHGVEGMVPYREATEIPAMVVMDLVEGPSLTEFVESRQVKDWSMVLRIAAELAEIVLRGHRLPERVLHRDLRPSNVMLDRYYHGEGWKVVVLDFDLSWHRDAQDESIALPSAKFGYLAPEQMVRRPGVSTRNASVDSYGIGMTLRFLASGVHPQPSEHLHSGWEERITLELRGRFGSRIRCLGRRFAHLIYMCTLDDQAKRWDMSQISIELGCLRSAENDPSSISSASLLAEELACRSLRIAGDYVHDMDSAALLASFARGPQLKLHPHEATGKIVIEALWASGGQDGRRMVNKWLRPAADRAASALRTGGFENVRISTEHGSASVIGDLLSPLTESRLDAAALAVDMLIDKLTLT